MTTTTATSTATRQIPATDSVACARYGATARRCGCPDAAKRNGGSYRDEHGRALCKHMAHVRAELAGKAQANISRLWPAAAGATSIAQAARTVGQALLIPPADAGRFAWLELA